jgi:hypothetical protein
MESSCSQIPMVCYMVPKPWIRVRIRLIKFTHDMFFAREPFLCFVQPVVAPSLLRVARHRAFIRRLPFAPVCLHASHAQTRSILHVQTAGGFTCGRPRKSRLPVRPDPSCVAHHLHARNAADTTRGLVFLHGPACGDLSRVSVRGTPTNTDNRRTRT